MLSLSVFGIRLGEILPLVFTVPHLSAPKSIEKSQSEAAGSIKQIKKEGKSPISAYLFCRCAHIYEYTHSLSQLWFTIPQD